ncbi:MAG: hypothetical protein LBB60_11670 [Desulfovibrio sp.]|jgi:tetratricopeptide (TPR) repeat protein|nr:hypothetical protein [Desulfovibrio sp.]
MTEKIEWYREVLEIEPNSKVFFPLARLLSEEKRIDEAMDVLEHGLERHPEFLEARLFFIELLHKMDRNDTCASQIAKLSKMFSTYAGFWQAWAACLSSAGDSPDTSLALRFLSVYFLNKSVSFHEVLDRGLTSMIDTTQPAVKPVAPQPRIIVKSAQAASAGQVAPPPTPAVKPVQVTVTRQPSAPPGAENTGAENTEEHFSLRTRSMAEVLAEQGDIQGALDIYHELLAGAASPGEKDDLQRRITTLGTLLANSREPDTAPVSPIQPESSAGKDKLISMLETLAERVEARAQS